MNRIFSVQLTFAFLFVTWIPCAADDPSPKSILERTSEAYQSLATYQSEGSVESDIETASGKVKQTTTFKIRLKKPELYVISWQQKTGFMTQAGTVWNDGSGPFLYMSVLNAYSKMQSDEVAIGGATGISSGAASTIPMLLLRSFEGNPNVLTRLTDPKLTGSEEIEGEDCYVIRSPSSISEQETLWISKQTHLIRKCTRSLQPPAGASPFPEMNEQELEDSIKALGKEVTEDSKRQMRESIERMREMVKNVKVKGTLVEIHTVISHPEMEAGDFAYHPPENAELKKSLFGNLPLGN